MPVICVPWRGGSPFREEAFEYVISHYAPLGYPIVTGDYPTAQFNRAGSRNLAALAAGDWDVAVMLDADCVIDIATLDANITRALARQRVVLPHDHFYGLTPAGSHAALREPNVRAWRRDWLPQPVWDRQRPSGVVIFPRAVWDLVGGYDELFTGWGFEDAAMLIALDALAGGYDREQGELWHFWHPEVRGLPEVDQAERFARYKFWRGNADVIRALLAERDAARLTAPAGV
jgi:hypothetical protein